MSYTFNVTTAKGEFEAISINVEAYLTTHIYIDNTIISSEKELSFMFNYVFPHHSYMTKYKLEDIRNGKECEVILSSFSNRQGSIVRSMIRNKDTLSILNYTVFNNKVYKETCNNISISKNEVAIKDVR